MFELGSIASYLQGKELLLNTSNTIFLYTIKADIVEKSIIFL